jgi:hypothetical protein
MGAFENHAEALIDRGYAAIPIMPGSKIPGYFCAGLWVPLPGWQRRYLEGRKPQPVDIAAWSVGNSGIGLVGGPSSHGCVGVDIDTDDLAILEAIIRVLPATPVTKIGRRGETRLFYGPDITISQSWNINGRRICDLIGPGRQTVLPPTMHPVTGRPYRWQGAGLEHYEPKDLPLLTLDDVANVGAALVPFGWRTDPPRSEGGNGISGTARVEFDLDADTPHRELNNFALAHLGRWVPELQLFKCRPARGGYEAVATWRPSSTGRPNKVRKLNLKIMPAGIRDFGDGGAGNGRGYTPLDLVMAAHGCDLDTAFKFLSDHAGWAGEPIAILSEPEPENPSKSEMETSAGASASGELEAYTHAVPGVLGDIIDWIVATARRPNRVLALAGAIPLVGTLIGRRVAGPTRSATHVYSVAVAPTGAGKQHPIDCANALMIAAGAQEHIGPGTFMSASALCNFVFRRPLSLCCSDEFGAYLAKLNARGASGHEREVTRVMRSLWGTSFTLFPTPEWADRETSQIHSPALSFLGTSTPDELFQALQGDAVENGLLNRFLVLRSDIRVGDTSPKLSPGKVPIDLAAKCCRLYRWHGTDAEMIDIKRPVEQQFTQLPWAAESAETEYLDFARMIDDRIEQDPALRAFFARAAETAIRLATIRAAGHGFRHAEITVQDVHWGAGIAWIAGQQLYLGAQGVTPITERGRWIERITDYVRGRNMVGKRATVRTFQQHIRCKLKATEVREMIAQLVQIGHLHQEADGTLAVIAKPAED